MRARTGELVAAALGEQSWTRFPAAAERVRQVRSSIVTAGVPWCPRDIRSSARTVQYIARAVCVNSNVSTAQMLIDAA